MTTEKPPLTTAEHIARAKGHLAEGAPPEQAIAHVLIAIAELMATNMTNTILDATARGAVASAEALATVLSIVNPGITAEGAAVVESGLTLRQAHELKTGCSADNPCAECRILMGDSR